MAESDETMDNWLLGRRYQAECRYELARQHLALALASARTDTVVEQLKQPQDITEQLKSENALEWVQKMNNIRACAIEVINSVC